VKSGRLQEENITSMPFRSRIQAQWHKRGLGGRSGRRHLDIAIFTLKVYKNARKGTRPGRLFRSKVSPRSSPRGQEMPRSCVKANSVHR
jgi:hypothetical protein